MLHDSLRGVSLEETRTGESRVRAAAGLVGYLARGVERRGGLGDSRNGVLNLVSKRILRSPSER